MMTLENRVLFLGVGAAVRFLLERPFPVLFEDMHTKLFTVYYKTPKQHV